MFHLRHLLGDGTVKMKQYFWLKLSIIFLTCLSCFFFSLSWFLADYHSRQWNSKSKGYLSQHFSLLYKHTQSYLKKNSEPSDRQLQKIISLYSKKLSKDSSLSIVNEEGFILVHSEPGYRGKKLPKSSSIYSLMARYPGGWRPVVLEKENSALAAARPVHIFTEKYFLVIKWGAQSSTSLFISYVPWTLLFSVCAFLLLFLFTFLYLRSFSQAAFFFLRLFGKDFGKGSQRDQKKTISYLTHSNNYYLKNIRWGIISFLKSHPQTQKQVKAQPSTSCFSDVMNKVVHRSRSVYPQVTINTEPTADINISIFTEVLFQALWEIIKNAVQAIPENKTGQIIIRTFRKDNKWFCCEVEDNGCGMDDSTREKASTLYFTTKTNAAGLGLSFVQSVLSPMGGIMKMRNGESGGMKVCLFIPLDYINYIQHLKKEFQREEIEPLKSMEV